MFHDDMRWGQGEMTMEDGQHYNGGWRQGKKYGQGVYTYPKKDGKPGFVYNGVWENGKRHGQGTM